MVVGGGGGGCRRQTLILLLMSWSWSLQELVNLVIEARYGLGMVMFSETTKPLNPTMMM